MPRDDYEKFQIAWSKKINEDYFLQSNKTDSLLSRCILKLRKNRTRIIEKTTKNLKMHEGIYIDIFPIDFVEEYDQKKLDSRAKKIKRLMTLRTIRAGYNSKRYDFFKKINTCLHVFISFKKIDQQIDKLCTKDNNKEHKYAVLFLHNYEWNKQFHEISIFGEGKEIVFCGYKINAPVDHNAF